MRLWPSTLVGRTVAVVLAGVVISNLIGLAVSTGERLDVITGQRARLTAERIAGAAGLLQETPPGERRWMARRLSGSGVRMFWSDRSFAEGDAEDWRARRFRDALEAALTGAGLPVGPDPQTGEPRLRLAYRTLGGDGGRGAGDGPEPGQGFQAPEPTARPPRRPERGAALDDGLRERGLTLELLTGGYRLDDGSWLHFGIPVAVESAFWQKRYAAVGLISTLITLAVTVWAVRRAARPLTTLAAAADRLGLDMDAPPVAEGGPREVAAASRAFNTMQARLQRFVRDRTLMLAAISHDLRTPITRLRLRAEFVEDEDQRARMLADLDDMEAMIAATLAFARDDPTREPPRPFDLAALLQAVCDDAADAGEDVSYSGPDRIAAQGRPAALKRAFINLVDNAVKYGDRARVAAALADETITVTVDDAGPGIAGEDLERVFDPFVRAEQSRSRDSGGVGLGLAVVRAAVRAHGGEVSLANRAAGGLRATVSLPRRC